MVMLSGIVITLISSSFFGCGADTGRELFFALLFCLLLRPLFLRLLLLLFLLLLLRLLLLLPLFLLLLLRLLFSIPSLYASRNHTCAVGAGTC